MDPDETREECAMSRHSIDDIRGLEIDGGLFCADCLEPKDWQDLSENQVVTEKQADDGGALWFCDRCGKQL